MDNGEIGTATDIVFTGATPSASSPSASQPGTGLDHVTDDDVMNTVIINVGGVRHEIGRSTLAAIPGSRLAKLDSLTKYYRKDKDEYYFDRHPGIFASILNFYRTRELHMPQDVCGPAFKLELDFWELCESQIQECCWVKYNVDKATRDTLELLGDEYTAEQEEANYMNPEPPPGTRCRCGSTWERSRAALWTFLDNPLTSRGAKAYAVISFLLAVLSIIVFCAETHPDLEIAMTPEHYAEYYGVAVDDLYAEWNRTSGALNTSLFNDTDRPDQLRVPHPTLVLIDRVLMGVFTLDILIRLVASPRKIKFLTKWLNVVDIVSIVPFYVELLVEYVYVKETYRHSFVDALFTLKVLRIFRIMRLLRHYKGLQVLALTLKYSYKELVLLTVFLMIFSTVFASLIFFANHDDKFFKSIPHGFWWAIVTMTTVGYGDVYPTTNLGYFVGTLCALSGVLVIAFTVPTLVNNFLMFYSHVQYRKPPRQKADPATVHPLGPLQRHGASLERDSRLYDSCGV